jgi:outer membrane immunogenic protein
MNKCLVSITALVALLATPALAADLTPAPIYTKAPPPPVYSWTGFYVGGNVGYSWGQGSSTYNDPNFAGFLSTTISESQSLDGIIGGGQIGYNWEANSTWVLGLEADIQGSGERGSSSSADPYSYFCDCGATGFLPGIITTAFNTKLEWFGTVRARLGVLVTPTTLLYGTGGLAYGGINSSGSVTDSSGTSPPSYIPLTWTFADSATKVGWTVGGGIEGAIWNTNNWTWKLEYLYLDLGRVGGTGYEALADFGTLPYTWSTKVTDNILRVGLNYHFH